MIKSYFKFSIYITLLVISVIVLTFYIYFNSSKQGEFLNTRTNLGNSVFNLIIPELQRIPQKEWMAYIHSLRPYQHAYYHHPWGTLNITTIDYLKKNLDYNKEYFDKLLTGRTVEHNDLKSISTMGSLGNLVLAKRLPNSNYVLQLFISIGYESALYHEYLWLNTLVFTLLKQRPKTQWNKILPYISRETNGADIELKNITDYDLNTREKILRNGLIVCKKNCNNNSQGSYLMTLAPDKETIVIIGPLYNAIKSIYNPYEFLIFISVIFLIISLLIMLGFYLNVRKLNLIAQQYGEGIFINKVNIRSSSILFPVFDAMKFMGNNLSLMITSSSKAISSLSHDLRHPLSRMNFILYDLETSIKDNTPINIDDIKLLKDEVKRQEHYIESISIELKMLLEYKNFTLKNNHFKKLILKEFIAYKKTYIDKSWELKIHDITNVFVVCDNTLITRVISNLLSNANLHAKQCIRVTWYQRNNYNHLIVEDDGYGIKKINHENIFLPYFNLEHKKCESNLGLGLFIVKSIIRGHKGTINVGSSELGGALFHVKIPQLLIE